MFCVCFLDFGFWRGVLVEQLEMEVVKAEVIEVRNETHQLDRIGSDRIEWGVYEMMGF